MTTNLNDLKFRYQFNEEEIRLLKERFDHYQKQGFLTLQTFRDMLGILGLEQAPFLSDRIFFLIDQDQDGFVTFTHITAYRE